MVMTDEYRLEYMAKHALVALQDDFGDWSVWEYAPNIFAFCDGQVTRNATFSTLREAIDAAIATMDCQLEADENG
jgi:hypothetical protein